MGLWRVITMAWPFSTQRRSEQPPAQGNTNGGRAQNAGRGRRRDATTAAAATATDSLLEYSDLMHIKSLGEGCFGTVDLMEVAGTGQRLAVKKPKLFMLLIKPELLDSFFEEGRLLRSLDHPNIVKLIAFSEHLDCEATPFIAMEVCEYGSLQGFVRNLKRRSTSTSGGATRAGLCKDIADGMAYLATKKIVHRDLATRNVLVTSTGVCKITDFGLTKKTLELSQEAEHRLENDKTYVYMYHGGEQPQLIPWRWTAPEALRTGMFSSMSDVWSFGILLWEVMTCGETPYDNGVANDPASLLRHLDEEYRLKKPAGCRQEIYDLMLACWDINPADRPPFQELSVALARIKCNRFQGTAAGAHQAGAD
eukprot:m.30472 g.30472  ORF g.30472 m.30472 type:complete len:366 (+) comp9454_c0_seq1:423-1520(+)